jgi:hypothetical protein
MRVRFPSPLQLTGVFRNASWCGRLAGAEMGGAALPGGREVSTRPAAAHGPAAGAGKRPGRDRAGHRAGRSASRPGLVAGLHESGFVGEYDCLDAVAHAELGEYPGDVCLDGGLAEEQLGSDLGV